MFPKLVIRSIAIEKKTVAAMITVYCSGNKHKMPCAKCEALKEYALMCLDNCPYGDRKPACKECPIQCYKPEMREKIKVVMRYAGPRMIWKYPWLSLWHKSSQWFYYHVNSQNWTCE
ncbi:MAG TPA: nitrous oxide-stimulated promoter family protein [Bacteroidales bacterium]|nr:nitrous oxide-stimulated promoter family protein [Bacteroidales bacterium]